MGVLHLVSRSPGTSLALAQCLGRAGAGDAVLLLEAGVYAASRDCASAASLREAMGKVSIHALAADLAARGIVEEEVLEGIAVVDYEGFVALAVAHSPALSWF